MRDLIVLKGPPETPKTVPRDSSGKSFPMSVFKKIMNNGEVIERNWLVWSQQTSALFCFLCCLFKDPISNEHGGDQTSKFVYKEMDNSWKKAYEKVKSHKCNVKHLQNYIKWEQLLNTLNRNNSAISEALLQQIREEENKWRKILTAVIDIVLFLAERNLAFRGNHLTVETNDCGKFLSTLKLIARYNPDISAYLETLSKARDSTTRLPAHYLSWQTQNEFLELCGKKVQTKILQEV